MSQTAPGRALAADMGGDRPEFEVDIETPGPGRRKGGPPRSMRYWCTRCGRRKGVRTEQIGPCAKCDPWIPTRTSAFADRFWSKCIPEPNTGCWLWTGHLYPFHRGNPIGYGAFKVSRSKATHAHRVAWEIQNGPIPEGLHALHRCDNPPCVNPTHIYLGTHAENMADRDRKGRTAKGKTSGQARLARERRVAHKRGSL